MSSLVHRVGPTLGSGRRRFGREVVSICPDSRVGTQLPKSVNRTEGREGGDFGHG